jgi:hypothetical protein
MWLHDQLSRPGNLEEMICLKHVSRMSNQNIGSYLEVIGCRVVRVAGRREVSVLLSKVTDSDTSTTVVPRLIVCMVNGSFDDICIEPTACATGCAVAVTVI